PVRVLRRDAEPPPMNRWAAALSGAVLVAGVAATATVQSRSLGLGLQFTAGLATVVAVLTLAAWGLSRLADRLPRRRQRLFLRQGLAALGRPGAATLGAIVALGMGVMVVLGMTLVERHLSGQLKTNLPETSPSAFLVDIQPDQWPGIQELLAQSGAEAVDSLPVVIARLTAVAGVPVEELARRQEETAPEDRDRRWALTREQRLTYSERLAEDNRILAGKLWSDPEAEEVSVEAGFADELGVGVGDRLAFDIQGVPLELLITSIRSVQWETFQLNFFLVVEPGALEDAPQFRVATARFPKDLEQPFQDRLAGAFPNVTMLRIREILEKIGAVLDRLALGVRFLGGFTVIAGLIILAGAVSAANSRRGREVALFKTLGLTRSGVVATFAVEYALIGLTAGIVGATAGGFLAWTVLTRGMEIEWRFLPLPFLSALVLSPLLTALAGCAASLQALRVSPQRVLQGDR
ncbi:MAG: FtsX-like permease family protein, partial [Acidobacteria bacterium]|nr:FtsX-like permease family protein [Acidobacteriota bacterium]